MHFQFQFELWATLWEQWMQPILIRVLLITEAVAATVADAIVNNWCQHNHRANALQLTR